MITDPSIRDQAYQYFLEEAPELLETIEQELFAINDGDIELRDRPLRVNQLMRATHTLKGGAANVGLETIKTVAHSMEDVFKALYNPELVIDHQTKKLLYASYDCLRIPLTAEFSKAPIDREEILNRAAGIFAELTEIFGDYLSDQDAFPTSEELGLDVVESFFESVVPERIQELSVALSQGEPGNMMDVLQSQAEIFSALSESLNLSGLGEIAQTILTALEVNPDLVKEITEAAIANFRQAQQQVMEGDRDRGGEPSAELKQFTEKLDVSDLSLATTNNEALFSEDEIFAMAGEAIEDNTEDENTADMFGSESLVGEFSQGFESEFNDTEDENATDMFGSESLVSEFTQNFESESDRWEFENNDNDDSGELTTQIWGEEEVESLSQKSVESTPKNNQASSTSIVPTVPTEVFKPKNKTAPAQEISTRDVRKSRFGSSKQKQDQQTNQQKVNKTVRVNLDSLEKLNDLVGELLINQNRNVLKDERIGGFVEQLLDKISYSEQIVNELIEVVDEVCLSPQQQQLLLELPGKLNNITHSPRKDYKSVLPDSEFQSAEARLNKLLELTGNSNSELVNIAEKIRNHNKQAQRDTQKQQRMLLNMRDELIETRMSPIGRLFNRFPRLLKQLSVTHDKKAELNIIGSHILIDKTIEEKLYDPLLHLVRNSFDHGLEKPDERMQTGKPETGTVFLRAYYQGSQTVIEVGDDGKGINIERIKQTGIEKKLITPEQAAVTSPSQLLELLFEPGFSTADKLSDLSGRGVGMDVVRSQVEEMDGTISIESTAGKGTTFSLQIPLTLTIAKLMLTEAAGMTYALLIDAIERIILPTSKEVQIFEGQKILHWKTKDDVEMIPVRQLSKMIEYPRTISKLQESESSLNNPILLLRRQNGFVGLEVDRVLGEQELVIRPLGSAIIPPRYIYGCSVLKDSSLTLVVDGAALLKDSQYRSNAMSQQAFLGGNSFPALPSNSLETPHLPPAGVSTSIETLPQTLLVVDDSNSLRRTIAMSLEKVCKQVLQADNGINALTELKKSGKVELVVCDLEMPLMNGFQFLKAISNNPEYKKLPVIILTSRDSDKHRKMALELGAVAYLVKPCPEQELISTIAQVIQSKQNN
ncbi:hybrid sensor histidine kinase/response regulator [Waterburya agarophytonicola K14]|uniref:histidine kinase n=1 Tax=Waterburya agarophytonicola KI4 TaxID=2874699 RepID=A0A964FGM8_9CYAN|nr:hybrid sensor histidine kinase/response regulator [Waterburya agarophytonicola]MCC0179110.1 hybrid sensor histidine kinase/response regulator [Waterburya agarophytonicola KI4]